jgi:uncharacterized C2H2 Zn-finger protein
MAEPYVVYWEGSYAYGPFFINSVEDPPVDPPIDPDLQVSSPTATHPGSWTCQTKGSTIPLFLDYTQSRPPLSIQPVSQYQINHSSPIDSPSCGPVHSPHTETESHFDSGPMTPPELTLPSLTQRSSSLEPSVQDMHFTHMGSAFVNPVDVNNMDFPETEDMFAQSPYVPYGLPSSQVLAQQSQGAVPAFGAEANSLEEAESQYHSLPVGNGPSLLKRGPADDCNDSDDSYQPRKRQRTGRGQGRGRGAQGAPSSARRTKAARSGRDLYSSTHSANGALACKICRQTFKSNSEVEAHIKKQHRRLFNCVFDFAGCEATFSTKNEWKRHVMTQHLLLYYWVCTEGACASQHQQQQQPSTPSSCLSTPNGAIFNRKDLFTQHLKRMHAPKEAKDQPKSQDGDTELDTDNNSPAVQAILKQWDARVKELQESCKRPRCALPKFMRCPVRGCAHAPFRGQEAWNLRMEHVAKAHMESPTAAVDPQPSKHVVFGGDDDPTLVEWASHPSVAIIEPAPPGLGRKWTLKTQLQRGPGGNVVVTAPTVNEPASPMLDSREAIVVAVDEDADADADEV